MHKKTAFLLVFALSALVACSSPGTEPDKFSGPTMGTTWSVQLTDRPGNLPPEELNEQIATTLDAVNLAMSTYRDDSEVVLFNRNAGTDWYAVSAAVANVVSDALAVSRLSDGAFDITVNPVVELWGFGAAGGRTEPPSAGDIAQARTRTGYQHLEVRLDPPALRKTIPELSIDLSAIAKGYAVDRVADLLEQHGSRNYLVEVGGELRARGLNARNTAWRIGVERPDPGYREVEQALPLRDRSMATSGDYRNFFEAGGQRYSHTIDPRTGAPVEHSLASVTILADNSMRADALATALLVMGPDAGASLARRANIAAMFIQRNPNDFTVTVSPAMQRYLDENPEEPLKQATRGASDG